MNKIDLIIECMEQILNDELPSPENMMKAFRYARELRELKPVGYMDKEGLLFNDTTHPHLHTPLYALDEQSK
jgi:hypothetical protein